MPSLTPIPAGVGGADYRRVIGAQRALIPEMPRRCGLTLGAVPAARSEWRNVPDAEKVLEASASGRGKGGGDRVLA